MPVNGKETSMATCGFRLQMQGYGLTTANILYRLPDHPAIIQSYIWMIAGWSGNR
jgi:uncharacterized protein Usg